MSEGHDEADAVGQVTHYYSHLSVAAVELNEPLAVGSRIHIKGHTTDLVQDVASMEIDREPVQQANPGDDVALKVDDHVREHDQIFREGG
jgi:putative protease